jgi:hypothetical protein
MGWQQRIFSISNGVRVAVQADGGDIAQGIRVILNGNCGRSKADGEERGRRLARYYRELVESVVNQDPVAIYERSVRLHEWSQSRSSMYTSCWNTMVASSRRAGEVAQMAFDVMSAGGPPSR